jgi:glucose/arabinose dehydrogenase
MSAEQWHTQRYLIRAAAMLLMLCIVFVISAKESVRSAFFAVPSGFTDSLVANGLTNPTAMEFAPDGRLFVCEQGGSLRVIKNGALLATPFVTITVNSSGERGLLGIAFDPDFTNNHFLYVYYTATEPTIHNRISRFTAAGDVAAANSEFMLLDLDNLSATNHNGGAIHFGPDGHLYAAVGENAVSSNSQTLSNLLGKILRILPNGMIPSNNPFDSMTTGKNKAIWALGLRNPFTFSFQPGTGRLFINDVGEGTREEINDGIAGSNYGWPNCEGNCSPPNANFRDPIYSYANDASTCAITGGTFYNPATTQFPPNYIGKYFFSDLCGGWIKILDPANGNTATDFATGISQPVDLKVSTDGSLYYLARGSGSVRRIQYTNAANIANVGVFRSGFLWVLDQNGDLQIGAPPDGVFGFGGLAGDIPITGDWNGDDVTEVGIYRSSTGFFILDTNGDRQITGADQIFNLGVGQQAGDIPVAGDWNGSGTSKVGIFRQGFLWILDTNGNGAFQNGVDQSIAFGGISGDIPIVGDWNGSGTSKIGIFRQGFLWVLDHNGDGVLTNVNQGGGDRVFAFGGISGDVPVVGDWNGDGRDKPGIFRNGFLWVLDVNGNYQFDGTAIGQDLAFPFGGISGDRPIVGRW